MKKHILLLLLFVAGLVLSAIHPRRFDHWVGEVIPAVVGMLVLVYTRNRFRFTVFTYTFILFACYLLFIGGHFTFSREPFFNWLKEICGMQRNNFDKFGHFIQGIVPVLITRELLIRRKLLKGKAWISLFSFCVTMAVSSIYEIIEFIACSIAGKNPDTFLGTQGYIWDSQTDMAFAALGGLFAVYFLKNFHDRAMKREFSGEFQ